jgi:tRNA threonylcarbamoyladenosine biosynthesis protein TsaE
VAAERERSAVHALPHLLGRGAPRAPDRASLEAWGRALGSALPRPVVITLAGELGAGKTTLVRALCDGLGVADLSAVTSPTFALLQEYASPRGAIVHADLYRLRSDAELEQLGWDELVASTPVLLVEWPERAEGALGDRVIAIELRHDPEHADRRLMSVRARGLD